MLLISTFRYARHKGAPDVYYRCCSWDRLETILATGSDVPPHDVLWTDSSPEKALEYGGQEQKIMLVLRSDRLERSYRQTRAHINPRRAV